MGNILSYIEVGYEHICKVATKRKIEELELSEDHEKYDSMLNAPKRLKLMSTSKYIYKALFEEGKESDVTVMSLGHVWRLHKVYLCQSPYFQSMFSGNWKETNESLIHIEILDDNVSIESLHIALGSFYLDELNFETSQVIPLLATSVLLQMDSLIDQCTSVMIDTVNIQTVLNYKEAARRYGMVHVERACSNWLMHNLLTEVINNATELRRIPCDLMLDLVSSAQLYVMQTEFSLYVLLKAWVFLILNPTWAGLNETLFQDAHKFFKNRNRKGCFLEEEGREFVDVFKELRMIHVIYHYLDVEMILTDRILPTSWLLPAATHQWFNMLRIDQSKEKGPKNQSEEKFNRYCTRNGRVIGNNSQLSWRWTGFNFGLDLIMTHDGNSMLKMKRNNRNHNIGAINQNTKRHLMYRVSVASLNEQKQVIYEKSTGIQSISLSKNEEVRIMVLDKDVKYPLILSVNFLLTTPVDYSILEENTRSVMQGHASAPEQPVSS